MAQGKHEDAGTPGAGNESRATVVGRWRDERALVRTDEGAYLEVVLPEEAAGTVDVGGRLLLRFGPRGEVAECEVLDDS